MNDYALKFKPASTQSTGGAGNNFENQVQAYFLLHLIRGCATKDGFLAGLQFQAASLGIRTADLVRTYHYQGQVRRIFTECKSSVNATVRNQAFADAISNAWLDFSDSLADPAAPFNRTTDRLALIYEGGSASKNMTTFRRLLFAAHNANSAQDFAQKCHEKNKKEILVAIASIIQLGDMEQPAVHLWEFLRVLVCGSRQFDGDVSADHDDVLDIITRHTGDLGHARLVWLGLVQQASKLNSNGATLDENNLAILIDDELLKPFRRPVPLVPATGLVPTFPWGAQLSAVHELRVNEVLSGTATEARAASVLAYLRAVRTASWLAPAIVRRDFRAVATTFAVRMDALQGSFDEKAALALFIMLNLVDEHVHRELVQWAARHADGRSEPHLREVHQVLANLDAHYHAHVASRRDVPGHQAGNSQQMRQRCYRDLRWGNTFEDIAYRIIRAGRGLPWVSNDRFRDICFTIDDNFPDYRHPAQDTAAWAGTMGVATFEALIKAVRVGSVGELLTRYSLCTSEATFERLLNVHAELSAHVAHGMQCISPNDIYIIRELEHLLGNAVAGEARYYVNGKLVVLPVQPNFPLMNHDLINIPFKNYSLAPAFEVTARTEHDMRYDDDPAATGDGSAQKLRTWETIFADTMLAMTLGALMFANSDQEADIANRHGIGVSQLALTPSFVDQ